jgi:hypothetical protein
VSERTALHADLSAKNHHFDLLILKHKLPEILYTYNCAADFSLLNLPKRKSLGRSKPATNSYAQAPQHTVWKTSTISKPY